MEASAPPPANPDPSAETGDAAPPDAGRPAIEPATRLAPECSGDPCYLAVSSNGGEHVCGLLRDGSVRCWGRDTRARASAWPDGGRPETDGALGRGRAVSPTEGATPAPVVGLSDVKQISVGRNLGTCARTDDGAIYCWGRNEYGQLGRSPDEASLPVPTRVEGIPAASFVALGATVGCAIASADRTLWCWGWRNSAIGRAVGPGSSIAFPPQIMSGFRLPIRELAIATSGGRYVGVAPFDDTIVALYEEPILASLGQLPAGESSKPYQLSTPAPVELPGVVRGGAFGYLATDGVLRQWLPTERALYVPKPSETVDVVMRLKYSNADMGYVIEQGGVLLSSGRLFRWGLNISGALGYPTADLDIAAEPRDMTPIVGDRIVSFAMTGGSTCVSRVDGKVQCYGSNQYGELGRGTIDVEEHPLAEEIR